MGGEAYPPLVHPPPSACPSPAGTVPPLKGRGGLACRHGVLFSSAAGSACWPIAIRRPSLGPFPFIGGGAHRPLTTQCPSSSSLPYLSLSTSLSVPLAFPSVGGGAHRPFTTLCPSSSSLPYLSLSTFLSFPFHWSVVPTETPDFPHFTALCQVHTEDGNPRRWQGVPKRSSQTGGEGPLPNGGFWATTFCLSTPALRPPYGERIMHPLPLPLYSHGVCV